MSARHDGQSAVGGVVYLIHLERPYRHARHYLGFTADLSRRISEHRCGAGSPLLRAAGSVGIDFEVVRTWPGDRRLERRLHNYKNTPARLCPVCRGETSPATGQPLPTGPAMPSQAATP